MKGCKRGKTKKGVCYKGKVLFQFYKRVTYSKFSPGALLECYLAYFANFKIRENYSICYICG